MRFSSPRSGSLSSAHVGIHAADAFGLRACEHSENDVDDEQFGGVRGLDVQSAIANHARRVVRPDAFKVELQVALDHVEVAAVPGLEPVLHTPARGIESYDVYFGVLRNHEPVARRAFGPHNLPPAVEAILTRVMVVLLQRRLVWPRGLQPQLDELGPLGRRRVPLLVLGAPAEPTLLHATPGE